ncbi:MAG TPA: site-2 protease family protein [Patescibacteria group bacterium]|nr:site-2 protease family protein [Patescibacteria group bacterium]
MLAVIVFIIILGVLVFVHELGHFVVARRNGIRAYEFGFGFPPRLFGMQKITDPKTGQKRWRKIWGHDADSKEENSDWDEIEKNNLDRSTIYSINWIPIGGFVKIKGEDGEHQGEPDSFVDIHQIILIPRRNHYRSGVRSGN